MAERERDVLHLNLHREFFDAIARKRKRIEYRTQSAYWRWRLEGRNYDAILFRNGYATVRGGGQDAPAQADAEVSAVPALLKARSASLPARLAGHPARKIGLGREGATPSGSA